MLLATSNKNQDINIWNISSGQLLYTLQGHANPIWSLAFSTDGRLLASGSGDQSIKLWSLDSGACLHTLQGHKGWISTIAFRLDGNVLVSGSSDQHVNLWTVHSGQLAASLQAHTNRVTAVALSPMGNVIISSDFAEQIILWNSKTKKPIQTWRIDRPYERMNITAITGVTEAQKASLKALGAVECVPGEEAISPAHNEQEDISLTRREQDILRLLSDGYNNNEIAQTLCVSKATVKTHINHVLSKLGVQDRTQAVAIARQLHLLP
jgi:WD40 repeat protein